MTSAGPADPGAGAAGEGEGVDEFGEIARLFTPLTGGAREALGLLDDAAELTPPEGCDLVVTTDTVVEGVHYLPGTPLDLVARKLLRVNLSDLAAKAASPWGWFLNIAWPPHAGLADRQAFARGLAEDQDRFGLRLFGGDTVATAGPLTASATLVGLVPSRGMVRRSGARAGDVLMVSGGIGDAGLGLEALRRGEPGHPLVVRHQLPEPRLALRDALRTHATAAADVSDGLLADVGRIATASRLRAQVRLDALDISPGAREWVAGQPDGAAAMARLATSGDDYEIVCTVAPSEAQAFRAKASEAGVACAAIGAMEAGAGVAATFEGRDVTPRQLGWSHG